MPIDYQLTEGDIGTEIDLTCKDDAGAAIDISTATITYRWKQEGKSLSLKSGTAADGPNGVARYTTVAGDVLTGDLRLQVTLVIAGDQWTSDERTFPVGSLLK